MFFIFMVKSSRCVKAANAAVAELADALDSKSSVVTPRAGSSPAFGTKMKFTLLNLFQKRFCLYNENRTA